MVPSYSKQWLQGPCAVFICPTKGGGVTVWGFANVKSKSAWNDGVSSGRRADMQEMFLDGLIQGLSTMPSKHPGDT